MPRGVDLGIDREDAPVGTDDIAHTLRGGGLLAVTSAVREPDFPSRVAEKGEVEVEFLSERAVLVFRVEADSQNLGVLLLELPDVVAEPATFCRSAGGIRLGVKPEDDDLPEVVPQPNEISLVILDFELGCFLALLEHRAVTRSLNEARRRRRPRAPRAAWCCRRGDRASSPPTERPRFRAPCRYGRQPRGSCGSGPR